MSALRSLVGPLVGRAARRWGRSPVGPLVGRAARRWGPSGL